MPDDDLIDRATTALEGITDGPWEVIGGGEYVTGVGIPVDYDNGGVRQADAVFIAAARTLVPELLAALVAAHADNERLRAQICAARAACQNAITDYVDDGEPVLAQYILDCMDGGR